MKVIDHYYLDQTEKLDARYYGKVRFTSNPWPFTRLLEATVNALIENGHTARDVDYVSTSSARCTWIAFCDIAREYTYPDSHGGSVINESLMVVGKNGEWWLERKENNDAEKWVYRRPPSSTRSLRPMIKSDLDEGEDET